MMIINDLVVNMNRYELIDLFIMTRLANPPETSGRPYEFMENVSDGNYFFKYSLIQLFAFLCFVFITEREIQVNYPNIEK